MLCSTAANAHNLLFSCLQSSRFDVSNFDTEFTDEDPVLSPSKSARSLSAREQVRHPLESSLYHSNLTTPSRLL